MTKQEITMRMSEITGKTEYETRVMLDAAISTMKESLQRGEEITLRGFGTFKIKTRAPKTVRNINTGEQYVIGVTRRVVFEPGKDLK